MNTGIVIRKYSSYKDLEKIIFWYTFFVAFPVIIIFFNISFFIFLFLLIQLSSKNYKIFTIKSLYSFIPALFAIGAFLSFYNSVDVQSSGNVLLNYFYWPLLLIVFYNIRNRIEISVIFNAILYSVIFSILYFFFLQNAGLRNLVIFNSFSQNSFSFLLICFSPIALYTFKQKYGIRPSFIFAFIILISAFYSGSRAGSILVSLGIFVVYFLEKVSIRSLLITLFFISGLAYWALDSQFVENTIYSLNSRTYDLLYNREFVLQNDRSYLTRVAMIEKGLEIYKEYPNFGIGLNNFRDYQVVLPGDFEGAKYVINKKDFQTISSHNSYINILAEGGLWLFIPFIMILLSVILPGIMRFVTFGEVQRIILFSIILMSIHLYFISAILNVFAWFLIGMGLAFFNKQQLSRN